MELERPIPFSVTNVASRMLHSFSWMFSMSCSAPKSTSADAVLRQLEFLSLAACPQRLVVTGVTLFFLVLLILLKILPSTKLLKQEEMQRINGCKVKVGRLFLVTTIASVILCLGYITLAIFHASVVFFDHQSQMALVQLLFAATQAVKWSLILKILSQEKFHIACHHPHLLRTWWICDFFLSCFLFSSSMVRLILGDWTYNYQLQVDDVFTVSTISLSGFLFIVALRGKTGLAKVEDLITLEEPLLKGSFLNEEPNITEYSKASSFSKAIWAWMKPLLDKGSKETLQLEDVPSVAVNDRAESTFALFQSKWPKERCSHPVSSTLFKCFWNKLAFNGLLAFIRLCVMYVGPVLIEQFVNYCSGERTSVYGGYYLVLVLLIAKGVEVLASHQYNFQNQKLGMLVRSTIITSVYHKGLQLSNSSRQRYGMGQIVNYMAVDAQQLSDVCLQLHNLWLLPAQVCIALTILYRAIGLPMLAGFVTMVVLVVANYYCTKLQRKYQIQLMKKRDQRMKVTSEILNFMKIIKLQAWEEHFQNRVRDSRMVEYGSLRKALYAFTTTIAMLWICPSMVSTVMFAACVILKTELTSAKVFTATATFRILQEPIRMFPQTLVAISQALVSLERLDKYMESSELDVSSVARLSDGKYAVEVEKASFSWEDEEPVLKDIDIQIRQGSLVAIVGIVGSGKSSLLASVIGEMCKLSGKVAVCGSLAYVAQTAWIQNGTVQQNILFGLPMDRKRYEKALRVCALQHDLDLMEYGDQTEIGERGINLSGGQKQRIQLARAVYQDCDIYLLDDVFSAVDAHTGTQLFHECILGALNGKTVLLVTHQVEFLYEADLILVMQEGRVMQSGKYAEILKSGTGLEALVLAHNIAMESISTVDQNGKGQNKDEILEFSQGSPLKIEASTTNESCKSNLKITNKQQSGTLKYNTKGGSSKLIDAEQRGSGRVGWKVYWLYYTKAFGWQAVALLLSAQIIWQSLTVLNDYWLAGQTSEEHHNVFNPLLFIEVYAYLAIGSWICVVMRVVVMNITGLKTAQMFFFDMLQSLFRAPMSFFDTTPSGRILSRFSTDQTMLDIFLPFFSVGAMSLYIASIGTLIVTCQVTWPVVLIILPLFWLYRLYQGYFIASSRELTRLDSITKAPVIFHFSETLAGIMTIRCFRKEKDFMRVNFEKVNANIRMDFHNNAANEWLGYRIEMLGTTVLCSSALFLVALPANIIRPDRVGLSLSYGLSLNACLYWSVWLACQVENKMVSVERLRQYTTIPKEAPAIVDNCRPPSNWPSKGNISMSDLKLRYRPNTPLVLKGINLNVQGGHKVGIVGRTGSGKSTLLQAIFRLVEPCGGQIVIDGIEITKMGLSDLRSKFAIIPQEPTLFEGNIRNNIDPLGQHSDDEIWEALKKCQLGDIVQNKAEKLDSPVLDNGENWSVGQKQLFCLGRALLKKSRILFLDEATASIDAQTEGIIQKTMQEQFRHSTVISIAHRIPSVMNSDRVVVMDAGEVKEYNEPLKLLEDPTSLFALLVHEYAARSGAKL